MLIPQAERARQARLVSDGAAGARAAAERIARGWGGGEGGKRAASERGEGAAGDVRKRQRGLAGGETIL